MDDLVSSTGGILVFIGFLFIYMLPSIVAQSRRHKSAGAIIFVNIFLGWTAICWLWAMIWSLTGNVHEKQGIKEPPGGWDKLSRPLNPKSRKDDAEIRKFAESIKGVH